jgi:hypothetical protein
VLIDFQIALAASPGPLAWLKQRFVRYMQGVDRYHLRKIHRRFRPFDFSPDELALARKKSWTLHAHGLVRRPYRAIRHFVLDRFLKSDREN